MEILVAHEPIDEATLAELAQAWHRTFVKGVADLDRRIIALGGDWHMDANNRLIADGSRQENLWGFNIYPVERGDAAIEYNSVINIRPAQGNRAMEITSEELRVMVRAVVAPFIPYLGL
ncbi:MAG: DUF5674 family protein [bacterium]|nr:DUF5674 family protein [bacterium]